MNTNQQRVLSRKLESLFPDKEAREHIMDLLAEYGRESYEREIDRVKLAILKLSGSDTNKITEYTQAAKVDYRDVLAWAEYPAQMKINTWKLAPEEKEKIIAQDLAQYESWLNE